jgi:hypothetical protein
MLALVPWEFYGGRLSLLSGVGVSGSSGSLLVQTMDAGANGGGELVLSTVTSSAGNSGSLYIGTGSMKGGGGYRILLRVFFSFL